MSSANKEWVRAAFEAMSVHFPDLVAGNADRILCYFREDAVWVNHGLPPDSVHRREGLDSIRAMLVSFAPLTEGAFAWRIDRLFAENDLVGVEAEGACTLRSGRRYVNKYCFVVRVAGSLIAEITEYMNSSLVQAAFERNDAR